MKKYKVNIIEDLKNEIKKREKILVFYNYIN